MTLARLTMPSWLCGTGPLSLITWQHATPLTTISMSAATTGVERHKTLVEPYLHLRRQAASTAAAVKSMITVLGSGIGVTATKL